jgi:hypothetical protein
VAILGLVLGLIARTGWSYYNVWRGSGEPFNWKYLGTTILAGLFAEGTIQELLPQVPMLESALLLFLVAFSLAFGWNHFWNFAADIGKGHAE